MMVSLIDAHREEFGVEPICAQLPIAPSTYYGAKSRPPSGALCRARRGDDPAAGGVVDGELSGLWGAQALEGGTAGGHRRAAATRSRA